MAIYSDGFFERDGILIRFLESVPVVGYIIAGIDYLDGDTVRSTKMISPNATD